jgi:molybdopterin-binding protein
VAESVGNLQLAESVGNLQLAESVGNLQLAESVGNLQFAVGKGQLANKKSKTVYLWQNQLAICSLQLAKGSLQIKNLKPCICGRISWQFAKSVGNLQFAVGKGQLANKKSKTVYLWQNQLAICSWQNQLAICSWQNQLAICNLQLAKGSLQIKNLKPCICGRISWQFAVCRISWQFAVCSWQRAACK